MQDAFRFGGRPGCIDEESRIVGSGIRILGHGPGFDGGGERLFGNDNETGREGAMRQAVVEDDSRGFGVLQHEGQFATGEVRRGRDGNEAARDRSEKRDRVGGAIAQANQDPASGLKLVRGAEGIGSPKHSLLDGGVTPSLDVAPGWIVNHKQRGFIFCCARGTQAISRHVEGLRRKFAPKSRLNVDHGLP